MSQEEHDAEPTASGSRKKPSFRTTATMIHNLLLLSKDATQKDLGDFSRATSPSASRSHSAEPDARKPTGGIPTQDSIYRRERELDRAMNVLIQYRDLLTFGDREEIPEQTARLTRQSLEEDRDITIVDRQLQKVGAESFRRFEHCIVQLDLELQHFAHTSHQLGSAVVLIASSHRIRARLTQMLYLFKENATALFPKELRKSYQETPTQRSRSQKKQARSAGHQFDHTTLADMYDRKENFFSDNMDKLAKDLENFSEALDLFPDFQDVVLQETLDDFETDLKYWASCLTTYTGEFSKHYVQRYLHDLTYDMRSHIETVTGSIRDFTKKGIPSIRSAQEHNASNLLNISTIATFFSAVSATTIQFSFGNTDTALDNCVNGFWFLSLVFSIGAAVNSLLGLTWKQAIYRSPKARVPWWMLVWINQSPLVFLVVSIICFSLGLIIFTFASGQHIVVATLTAVVSAFSCIGLAIVSAWFASERMVFQSYAGIQLLPDVLNRYGGSLTKAAKALSIGLIHKTVSASRNWICGKPKAETGTDVESCRIDVKSEIPKLPLTKNVDFLPGVPTSLGDVVRESDVPNTEHGKQRTIDSPGIQNDTLAPGPLTYKESRVTTLKTKLGWLKSTHDFQAHSRSIAHMQFSPNGRYLATSSSDETCCIFLVEEPYNPLRIFGDLRSRAEQVKWSPTGHMILIKLRCAIEIWTEDGVFRKIIDRHRDVTSLAWLPDGRSFLSVEKNTAVRLDLEGKVLHKYALNDLEIHRVAVTKDSQRMVCVGSLMRSGKDLQPIKSRTEQQIIVYNIVNTEVEHRVPVIHDARDITLACGDTLALVSYEGQAPPQLWRLYPSPSGKTWRLSLERTYLPSDPAPVEFSGMSYFGGREDRMVVSTTKAGGVYIWDREFGTQLQHIRAQSTGSSLTCSAWNHGTDEIMFATGNHEGAVKVWTASTPPPTEQNILESQSLASPSKIPLSPSPFITTTAPGDEAYDPQDASSILGSEPPITRGRPWTSSPLGITIDLPTVAEQDANGSSTSTIDTQVRDQL